MARWVIRKTLTAVTVPPTAQAHGGGSQAAQRPAHQVSGVWSKNFFGSHYIMYGSNLYACSEGFPG